MTDLIVEADGGSRGNPGIAGAGALVKDTEGRILAAVAVPLGRASNNVAEYTGLIEGLKLARQIDPAASVEVRLDSKLVVEQMSGRWKIKHEDMKRLAHEASQILSPMQVTYTWVPRKDNGAADQLSNEAMDASAAGTAWDPAASAIQPSTSRRPG
ncbi:reverse transcriptase-like protein [Nesterenkonia alba]|uniref:reverse transcriptase-like protein n=1 Tax=Nesterenkonia alba TaxID=515814 RepID=UPI0003B76330